MGVCIVCGAGCVWECASCWVVYRVCEGCVYRVCGWACVSCVGLGVCITVA